MHCDLFHQNICTQQARHLISMLHVAMIFQRNLNFNIFSNVAKILKWYLNIIVDLSMFFWHWKSVENVWILHCLFFNAFSTQKKCWNSVEILTSQKRWNFQVYFNLLETVGKRRKFVEYLLSIDKTLKKNVPSGLWGYKKVPVLVLCLHRKCDSVLNTFMLIDKRPCNQLKTKDATNCIPCRVPTNANFSKLQKFKASSNASYVYCRANQSVLHSFNDTNSGSKISL